MRGTTVGRIAAVAAIGAAVLIVAVVLLRNGGAPYTVTVELEDASQLVPGNLVRVGGQEAGNVTDIGVSDDGMALVEVELKDEWAPLREGVFLETRHQAVSSVAGRRLELTLPKDGKEGDVIESGDVIPVSETKSSVDIDHFFNLLDEETREDLQRVLLGFRLFVEERGADGNRAFRAANPFLSSFRRLAGELNRDERALEELLVSGAQFSGALAERRDDVAGFVREFRTTFGALASEREALADLINEFPDFMRGANTTFVNLRATLDDLDPLVEASRPSARRLQTFLPDLRRFTQRAAPTVRSLATTIRRPGRDNDLIDLNLLQPRLAQVAAGPVEVRGKLREGAFPSAQHSLEDGLPRIAHFRPYAPELVGWFDGFGHSGTLDANGGVGRIGLHINAFSPSPIGNATALGDFIPPEDRRVAFEQFQAAVPGSTGNRSRCPGAHERPTRDGSTPFTDGGALNCDPTQMPIGP